ncbi:MAG: hypothetical protein AB7G08_23890 [Hyphomicrobiaceae bacterium]
MNLDSLSDDMRRDLLRFVMNRVPADTSAYVVGVLANAVASTPAAFEEDGSFDPVGVSQTWGTVLVHARAAGLLKDTPSVSEAEPATPPATQTQTDLAAAVAEGVREGLKPHPNSFAAWLERKGVSQDDYAKFRVEAQHTMAAEYEREQPQKLRKGEPEARTRVMKLPEEVEARPPRDHLAYVNLVEFAAGGYATAADFKARGFPVPEGVK